jgi:hypothetical protein
MCEQDKVANAIEVLKGIALVSDGTIFERQRAIDALTLFHEKALPALEEIVKKVDSKTLKEFAGLYAQRIRDGVDVNTSL